MTQKLQLYLSDDAAEIIRQSTTERRRGEWLSNVVLEYHRIVTGEASAPSADAGLLERIDARLANVERQLAVLIQKAPRSNIEVM